MARPSLFAVAAASATVLSACAPVAGADPSQASSPGRQCFYADQVDNFRGDSQTLYVRTHRSDVFELQSFGYCSDIDFAFSIAFLPNSGSNRLCTGDLSRIIVGNGPSSANQCRVQVVKKLTAAEVEALPERNRP